MTQTAISVHLGINACCEDLHGPSEGARIEIHYPNVTHPLVITVERQDDDWIPIVQGSSGLSFRPRACFPDALEDALAFVASEAESRRE